MDWSIRPLSKAMLEYTAGDVAYLVPLKDILIPLLNEKIYHTNVLNYCESLSLVEPIQPEIEAFNRIKKFSYNKLLNLTDLDTFVIYRIQELTLKTARKIEQ